MSERRWTPGPWVPAYWSGEINGGESGGKPVIDMNTETFDRVTACVQMDDEERANFTLIAAAPDLYEALEQARDTILQLINARNSEAEGSDEDWVGGINTALAKARGETQ